MIIYKTGARLSDVHEFPSLVEFNGSLIKGDGFFTVIPISSFEHRQGEDYKRRHAGKQAPFVRFWKGDKMSEFLITDDWNEDHQLLIPNEMEDVIQKGKAAILENKIPANFK